VDSLLSRAASFGRIEIPRQQSRENFMRRATIDAIDDCLRLDAARSTFAFEPNVT
jgi:hypothetical protein